VKIGVVTFPGSLDDSDAVRAVRIATGDAVSLWHGDADLRGVDAIVLPGGFSYGDYLRCGAIARFAPIMEPLIDAARGGMPVLGICNGFQVLCEAGLLPGALTRNGHLHFRNRDQALRIERADTAWTQDYETGQRHVARVGMRSPDVQSLLTGPEVLEIRGDTSAPASATSCDSAFVCALRAGSGGA
jgi:phosphoribosylformylglycinamidine synthase subunit PurQ / glutaminase